MAIFGGWYDSILLKRVFVKDGKTYHIPDKRIQSLQAFRSELSYQDKEVPRLLHMSEGSLFGLDVPIAEPVFRECCNNKCGSLMMCNGCSNCCACKANKETY